MRAVLSRDLIRSEMIKNNLGVRSLSRASGVPASTLSDLLASEKDCKLSNAVAIADALNVSVDKLVERR